MSNRSLEAMMADACLASWATPSELQRRHERGDHRTCPEGWCDHVGEVMGEPSDLFEDYRRMVPREFDVERQGDVRTTPGEEYYIEHGWSGCDGSSWKRLTQATRDGWEAAARECARADRLQEQLS